MASIRSITIALSGAAIVALGGLAPAQHASAATLREELTRLLAEHPRLRAEKHRVASADQQVRRAFAAFLPKLSFAGDAGPEYIDAAGAEQSERLVRSKGTLTLTQNLFAGNRDWQEHKAAKIRGLAARHRLEATRQSLLLEGISAYYDILRQSRLIAIAHDNEKAVRTQLELEDERVQRGGGIAVDALLAKTRLQLGRERTVQFVGLLEEARARYRQIFAREARLEEMSDPYLNLAALPDKLDDATEKTVTSNPALLASERDVRVAAYRAGAARADFVPRVDIVGQVNREHDLDATQGSRRDWSILIKVTWDLFSGFATTAAAAAAAEDKAVAQDTYLFNRRKIEEELRISWRRLETARKRVALLDNAVVIAELVFKARRRLRDAGKETAINVLDAQTELFTAQMNRISASFDAEIAAFRVLFAMGVLTPKTLGL